MLNITLENTRNEKISIYWQSQAFTTAVLSSKYAPIDDTHLNNTEKPQACFAQAKTSFDKATWSMNFQYYSY